MKKEATMQIGHVRVLGQECLMDPPLEKCLDELAEWWSTVVRPMLDIPTIVSLPMLDGYISFTFEEHPDHADTDRLVELRSLIRTLDRRAHATWGRKDHGTFEVAVMAVRDRARPGRVALMSVGNEGRSHGIRACRIEPKESDEACWYEDDAGTGHLVPFYAEVAENAFGLWCAGMRLATDLNEGEVFVFPVPLGEEGRDWRSRRT